MGKAYFSNRSPTLILIHAQGSLQRRVCHSHFHTYTCSFAVVLAAARVRFVQRLFTIARPLHLKPPLSLASGSTFGRTLIPFPVCCRASRRWAVLAFYFLYYHGFTFLPFASPCLVGLFSFRFCGRFSLVSRCRCCACYCGRPAIGCFGGRAYGSDWGRFLSPCFCSGAWAVGFLFFGAVV